MNALHTLQLVWLYSIGLMIFPRGKPERVLYQTSWGCTLRIWEKTQRNPLGRGYTMQIWGEVSLRADACISAYTFCSVEIQVSAR